MGDNPRIDYAASGVTLTNAVLTLTNGVRVGTYGRVSWGVRTPERSWSLDG